jgi:hypothetical protein
MSLIDEPICIACGMKDESAFHLLCNCPSLISLRMHTISKPILSVEEYEGRLSMHCCESRWELADSLGLLDSFILMNISFFSNSKILFFYLSLLNFSIFHLCGAH